MGSVSRGRWRKGAWPAPADGMASWLLAALLLALLTASLARPPLTATTEEEEAEATAEPEGEGEEPV
ncbi:hypothetical protein EYF80_068040 [Liparis tanakae]|uniref:Uncharacterized protein n=1 Tax=Liparis tanakae TaxID=230148 RepID=A0A4Z2DZG3_9TELE|nr:hypothetical protein EYF80_068040 [Liparis tanakae]